MAEVTNLNQTLLEPPPINLFPRLPVTPLDLPISASTHIYPSSLKQLPPPKPLDPNCCHNHRRNCRICNHNYQVFYSQKRFSWFVSYPNFFVREDSIWCIDFCFKYGPFSYFYGHLGTIHLVNVKDFDLYAPSMNYAVADIYLLDRNLCKYDTSNWLAFLVNCDDSILDWS